MTQPKGGDPTTGTAGRRGRPRIDLTDEQVEQVEKLSAYLTQEQIADFFGFSDRTLRQRITDDERVASAYARGRARAVARVGQTLLEQADGGNVRAIEFYLKAQAGWKETEKHEHTGEGGGPIAVSVTRTIVRPNADG